MTGALLLSVSLVFHGVMGQSAPVGEPPLGFTGTFAVSDGPKGRLFVLGDDERLYEIRNGQTVALNCPAKGFRLDWDGRTLRSMSFHEVWEYTFDGEKATQRHAIGRGDRRFDLCAVLPEGRPDHPFARFGKFFVYDEGREAIVACDEKGEERSVVVRLPARKGGAFVCGVAFLPGSGDIVVVTHYPDMAIRRFDATGREVLTSGWPIARGKGHFTRFGKRLFHCSETSIAEIADDPRLRKGGELDVGSRPFGLVSDGSRDYLASACGLLVRDRGEAGFLRRQGGIGPLDELTLEDGRVGFRAGESRGWMYLDNVPDDLWGEWGKDVREIGRAARKNPSKRLLDLMKAAQVPGGIDVGKVTGSGKWVVAEDLRNRRLVRFCVLTQER